MTKFDWERHALHRSGPDGVRPRWSADDYPVRGPFRRPRMPGLLGRLALLPQQRRAGRARGLPPVERVLQCIRDDMARYEKARRRYAPARQLRALLVALERNLLLIDRYPRPLPAHLADLGTARRLIRTHRRLIDIG